MVRRGRGCTGASKNLNEGDRPRDDLYITGFVPHQLCFVKQTNSVVDSGLNDTPRDQFESWPPREAYTA
jgi:hypothetical protein